MRLQRELCHCHCRNAVLAVLALALAAGCDDDTPDADADADVDADADADVDADEEFDSDADADADGDGDAEVEPNPDCDPLVPTECALPWPSNLYLRPDPGRATGFVLEPGPTSLPSNFRGEAAPPAIFSHLDGYSVGTNVIVHFPSVDVSALPGEASLERSMADGSPVVLLEAPEGGAARRVPCWAELDSRSEPADALLFVRPAEILRQGTRYIVAFRGLVDVDGAPFEPSPAFALLRDGGAAGDPLLAPRVERFEAAFADLEAAGVARSSLQLAWDFNTASHEAAHGDMLSIRDQALALVGPDGPELTITEVEEYAATEDGSGLPVDAQIAYRIHGTFHVPDFTEAQVIDGLTGRVIHRDEAGAPAPNEWVDRAFVAMIPRDNGSGLPLELMQYGHGLLGSCGQVFSGHNRQVAFDHGQIYFGSNLTGFSEDDLATVMSAVSNMELLPWFADRILQGLAEHLMLPRAMAARFLDLPEIQALTFGDVDTSRLHYSGISQGGIMGSTIMALSTDITRGHLGVPGQNYNLLLERSTDFEPYLSFIGMSYEGRSAEILFVETMTTLWQTSDPVSYMRHIAAEPFPGTPAHAVLLAQAQGDWQVAPITNEITARSALGVVLMEGYGRDVYGVDPVAYPHTGSALVNYDFGVPWAEPGNHPPAATEVGDPHGLPRREAHHNVQMMHFLHTGEVIDVCGGDGCTPD